MQLSIVYHIPTSLSRINLYKCAGILYEFKFRLQHMLMFRLIFFCWLLNDSVFVHTLNHFDIIVVGFHFCIKQSGAPITDISVSNLTIFVSLAPWRRLLTSPGLLLIHYGRTVFCSLLFDGHLVH